MSTWIHQGSFCMLQCCYFKMVTIEEHMHQKEAADNISSSIVQLKVRCELHRLAWCRLLVFCQNEICTCNPICFLLKFHTPQFSLIVFTEIQFVAVRHDSLMWLPVVDVLYNFIKGHMFVLKEFSSVHPTEALESSEFYE